MVTMVTTPKSAGVNSRARMTVPDHLSRERQRRGGQRRGCASNGEASQFAAFALPGGKHRSRQMESFSLLRTAPVICSARRVPPRLSGRRMTSTLLDPWSANTTNANSCVGYCFE